MESAAAGRLRLGEPIAVRRDEGGTLDLVQYERGVCVLTEFAAQYLGLSVNQKEEGGWRLYLRRQWGGTTRNHSAEKKRSH